ncbi:hypothetical protein F5144DRAFT_559199 [Chaetomium tenue]|uniref:Uncharacterized protein n=1 Tax=Chaetomium tenue TaxID=1854479 RepID=A0ACB7PTB8_9PEZI|nr:hypothetical protein F5144DRAFT_559199 [Chaetomium globosum]
MSSSSVVGLGCIVMSSCVTTAAPYQASPQQPTTNSQLRKKKCNRVQRWESNGDTRLALGESRRTTLSGQGSDGGRMMKAQSPRHVGERPASHGKLGTYTKRVSRLAGW